MMFNIGVYDMNGGSTNNGGHRCRPIIRRVRAGAEATIQTGVTAMTLAVLSVFDQHRVESDASRRHDAPLDRPIWSALTTRQRFGGGKRPRRAVSSGDRAVSRDLVDMSPQSFAELAR